jgi:hypothetical protein
MSSNGKSPAEQRRLEMLETTPATRAQVGAILGEFRRLRIHQRDERLLICATLLDLDELTSTWELTMGRAGKLIQILRATHNREDLNQRVEAAKQERLIQHEERGTSIVGNLRRFIADILKG